MAVAMPPPNFLALQRFGLGARPGDLKAIAADPRGAVLAEIAPQAVMITDPQLPTTAAAMETLKKYQMDRKAAKQGGQAAKAPAATPTDPTMAPDAQMAEAPDMDADVSKPGKKGKGRKKAKTGLQPGDPAIPGNPIVPEFAAQLALATQAQVGFAERWAMFWTNHFAVEADANALVRWAAGAYDREAIRPHVFGKFAELLYAATQHPVMLRYLNNATSVGPDSKLGQRQSKGLNENHARELMELHTIGVDAGYTQADVTSFAKVLTGWTFGLNANQPKRFAQFFFNPNAHEPGPQTVLGTVYGQKGVQQGDAVLDMLAAHQATAGHIATKLVRAFVADTPPQPLVDAVAKTFRDTDGDLAEVAKTLVTHDLSWSTPATKMRLPQEYLLAAARGLQFTARPALFTRALTALGQPLFNPPSPEGFHDDAATWLAPDAMTNRLDIAQQMAELADASADPRAVANDILGEAQSVWTRNAIAAADGPVQGLAIMLMSPEFQRR